MDGCVVEASGGGMVGGLIWPLIKKDIIIHVD